MLLQEKSQSSYKFRFLFYGLYAFFLKTTRQLRVSTWDVGKMRSCFKFHKKKFVIISILNVSRNIFHNFVNFFFHRLKLNDSSGAYYNLVRAHVLRFFVAKVNSLIPSTYKKLINFVKKIERQPQARLKWKLRYQTTTRFFRMNFMTWLQDKL